MTFQLQSAEHNWRTTTAILFRERGRKKTQIQAPWDVTQGTGFTVLSWTPIYAFEFGTIRSLSETHQPWKSKGQEIQNIFLPVNRLGGLGAFFLEWKSLP